MSRSNSDAKFTKFTFFCHGLAKITKFTNLTIFRDRTVGQRNDGKVNRRAPSSLLNFVINFVVNNVILPSFRAKCFQEANECGN